MNIAYTLNNLAVKLLPPPIANSLKYRQFLKSGYHSEMWGGGIYSDNLKTAISKFASGTNRKDLQKLIRDITLSYINYGATPDEYFLLGFLSMKDSSRGEFVTDRIKDEECLRTASLHKFKAELTNKYNFYKKNKNFFQRDAILVSQDRDFETFETFLRQNGKVFAKPIDGSYGKGAHIITYTDDSGIAEEFTELIKSGSWIIEQIIIQSQEMAEWNPSSVNTVRIPSVLHNGKSVVIGPFFRTGRSGAIVDNAGGGGILAAIDPESGIVISDGFSEDNTYHEFHPDSRKKYKGWRIPQWNELLTLAEEIHKNMPAHKYIAFDFALTSQGWVLIEGNWGQFLWQYATKKGLKKEFLKLMRY